MKVYPAAGLVEKIEEETVDYNQEGCLSGACFHFLFLHAYLEQQLVWARVSLPLRDVFVGQLQQTLDRGPDRRLPPCLDSVVV